MSDTATTTEQVVKTEATAALSWLQRHERIVLVFLVLATVTWLGQKYLDVKSDRAQQAATVAVAQLTEQKNQNAQLATQVGQLSTQYQGLQVQLAQENAALASAMSNRVTVLHEQQAAIKTMPLPELGNRWAQLTGVSPAELKADTTGISVTDTVARATVDQLELVPVLQANLTDSEAIADNRLEELTKANGLIDGLNTQVVGLNKTVESEEVVRKAEVAAAKAEANKSKGKWFKAGFITGNITGFIGGLFVGRHI